MPKYTVHGSCWVSIDVEAEDEHEALWLYSELTNDLETCMSEAHTIAYRDTDSAEKIND